MVKDTAVTFATLLAVVTASCPSGQWHSFHNSCYLLKNDVKVTWFHAMEACDQLGGWLVDIRSADEDNFLKTTIRARHTTDDPQTIGYWISANDLANEGTFVWGFPSNDNLSYTDWFPGEPNNIWYDQRHEDCVAMWGHDKHNYQWNDQPCEIEDYYICETEIDAPPGVGR